MKKDIYKILIPIIGIWWILKRLPIDSEDDDVYPNYIIMGLFFYHFICWIIWKISYYMYMFDVEFKDVFDFYI